MLGIRKLYPALVLVTEGGLRDGLVGWQQFGHLQYDASLAAERSCRRPLHELLTELTEELTHRSESGEE